MLAAVMSLEGGNDTLIQWLDDGSDVGGEEEAQDVLSSWYPAFSQRERKFWMSYFRQKQMKAYPS